MCYAGIWEDGDDDYYEWNDMSSAEAEEMLPEALNEMYGISEYLAECESQEEDCE
jgi:hypothetical protein